MIHLLVLLQWRCGAIMPLQHAVQNGLYAILPQTWWFYPGNTKKNREKMVQKHLKTHVKSHNRKIWFTWKSMCICSRGLEHLFPRLGTPESAASITCWRGSFTWFFMCILPAFAGVLMLPRVNITWKRWCTTPRNHVIFRCFSCVWEIRMWAFFTCGFQVFSPDFSGVFSCGIFRV